MHRTDKAWLKKYFKEEVFPILTPLAIDPSHPFPFVPNLGLCIVLKLKNIETSKIIRVIIPFDKGLDKFIKVRNSFNFIKIEDLIIEFIDELFPRQISYHTEHLEL